MEHHQGVRAAALEMHWRAVDGQEGGRGRGGDRGAHQVACVSARTRCSGARRIGGSDDENDVTVLREQRIGRHEPQRLGQRLRDQQPVEGIVVVGCEAEHARGM